MFPDWLINRIREYASKPWCLPSADPSCARSLAHRHLMPSPIGTVRTGLDSLGHRAASSTTFDRSEFVTA